MAELRTIVRKEMEQAGSPSYSFDDLGRRRDRKRRNQRIAAGVVGMAVFVAMVPIVTGGLSFLLTGTSAPGSGPANQSSSAPVVSAVGPAPDTDYLLDLNTGETTPLPETIVGTEDLIGDYAASPDGSKLAYAGPGDNGERQVFVANLDGTGVEQVTSEDRATNPAWSPDGSKIAYIGFIGDDTNIFVLDLATGSSTRLTSYAWPIGVSSGPSFSPDGESILYSSYDNSVDAEVESGNRGIWMVPAFGGESVQLVAPFAYDAQFSPDGSLLAYACQGGMICLANADGTDVRPLGLGPVCCPRWSPDGTLIAFWEFHGAGDPPGGAAFVADVATLDETNVAEGVHPVWLDDHTLIVEHDRCPGPKDDGCGG